MDQLPDMPTIREYASQMIRTILDDPDSAVPIPAIAFLAAGLLANTAMRCPDCDELHHDASPIRQMRETFGSLVAPTPVDISEMKTIRNTLLTLDGETEEAEKVIAGLINATVVFSLLADNPTMESELFTTLSPRRFDFDASARRALGLMLDATKDVPNDWTPVFVQSKARADFLLEHPANREVDHIFNPPVEMLGIRMSMN